MSCEDKKCKCSCDKDSECTIENVSFNELYAMYLFVSNDANNRGFGLTTPDAKAIVRDKYKEIEEELYKRVYGYNPFVKYKKDLVVEGMKPEDVLSRVSISSPESPVEPEDEEPQTFVVADPKKEENE